MQWSKEKAWQWYRTYQWLCGFNYLPQTAVNYLDFWQAFDEKTIEQELEWAEKVGFNSVRVVLPFLLWQANSAQMRQRFDRFLQLAASCNLWVMPCLFDDCGFSGDPPRLGVQPAPVPGLHNSRAVASPGRDIVIDKTQWSMLERYVRDMISNFAQDERVLLWDLYNEPGNRMIFSTSGESEFDKQLEEFSHQLMVRLFEWARDVAPVQPLTVAGWHLPPSWEDHHTNLYTHPIDLTAFSLSDVVSFHAYCRPERLRLVLAHLQQKGRPLFCTEWMARHAGSNIHDQLPIFADTNVATYQWGLVKGKTQTHIPWPAVLAQIGEEEEQTEIWFHDLLYPDGSPYDEGEVALITQMRAKYS